MDAGRKSTYVQAGKGRRKSSQLDRETRDKQTQASWVKSQVSRQAGRQAGR